MTTERHTDFTNFVDTNSEMQQVVQTLGNNKYEIMLRALRWIRGNIGPMEYEEGTEKRDVWRKRKATEVFASRMSSGCTDNALVFLSFMRSAGIPANYIEGISEETVAEFKNGTYGGIFEGHIFARVFIGDEEFLVDPSKHQIYLKNHLPVSSYATNNLIMAEGADFQDVGTDTHQNLEERVKEYISSKC